MESRVHCLFVFAVVFCCCAVYCYSLSFVVRLCFFRSCALSCCAVRCERWNPDTGQIDQPASKTFLSRLWRWWCWWASAWWCLLIQLRLGNYEELECNISENYLVIRFFCLFFLQWALSLQVGFDLIGFKWIWSQKKTLFFKTLTCMRPMMTNNSGKKIKFRLFPTMFFLQRYRVMSKAISLLYRDCLHIKGVAPIRRGASQNIFPWGFLDQPFYIQSCWRSLLLSTYMYF